jgi:hypothetical protein
MVTKLIPSQIEIECTDNFFISIVECIKRYESLSDSDIAELLTSSSELDRKLAQAIIYWRDNAKRR